LIALVVHEQQIASLLQYRASTNPERFEQVCLIDDQLINCTIDLMRRQVLAIGCAVLKS
jgi:hypothetical protein